MMNSSMMIEKNEAFKFLEEKLQEAHQMNEIMLAENK